MRTSASHRAVALRVGGRFGEGGSPVSRKLCCHARQNFPKERVKAGNEFSMKRGQRRPKNEKENKIMKNQNIVFVAIAFGLAFALAPVTKAAPNPGGGPSQPPRNESGNTAY